MPAADAPRWRCFFHKLSAFNLTEYGVRDKFLTNYLDLIAFLLQGLPSNGTRTTRVVCCWCQACSADSPQSMILNPGIAS